jgi:hypothetical protein
MVWRVYRRCHLFNKRIDEYALTVRRDVIWIGVQPCRTWMDREERPPGADTEA